MSQTIGRNRTRGPARNVSSDLECPNSRSFIAMLEAFRASGGVAPGPIVGQLLGEYRVGKVVRLEELMASGHIFGFSWRANVWIPVFQFETKDLALKASAQSVRAELPSLWSGWQVASWFAAPSARMNGHSPADRLDSDLEAVVQAALALESIHRFSALPPPRAREGAA